MQGSSMVQGSTNLTDRAYRFIEEQIVEMHVAPGERLSEAEVARLLHMSRGPVREALRKLESVGLVIREENRGVRVAEFDEKELVELDSLRCHLQALAGRLAALNASPFQIREMRKILEKMKSALDTENYSKYSELNIQFHDLLNEMTANRILTEHIGQVLRKIRRYNLLAMSFREGMRDSFASHQRIHASIEARDSSAAEKELSDHGRLSYRLLISNFDRLRRAFRSDGISLSFNGRMRGAESALVHSQNIESK
jgi:DNA-binding GntR family transcriptional regulator